MNIKIVNPMKMQWEPSFIKAFRAEEGWTVDPGQKPDVVIRMWCDRDTVKYVNSLDKAHHPKVIVFIRRYEFFTRWIEEVDWDKVDAVVMVNHFLAKRFQERTGARPHVILNAVNLDAWTYKERGHGNKIAVVGYVNQKKNLPLALQIVSKLNEVSEKKYELHFAGGIQDGATMVYISELAKQLGVWFQFYGHVNDIDEWLEDKNYLLSCAISEGCPNNVIEAMAKGVKPVVHNWPGSLLQFSRTVFNTIDQAVEMMSPESEYDSKRYRQIIEQNHGPMQYQDFVRLIKEVMGIETATYHHLDWSPQMPPADVDVNLISYPKSGRTWLRLFLQLFLIGKEGELRAQTDYFYPKTTKYPRIFSSHTHLNWNGGKTVFLLRDPRDIVVSSYFHNQRRSKAVPMDMTLSEYIHSDGGGIKFIIGWLNKWHERLFSNGGPPPLILRYEDLIEDDYREFAKMLDYMSMDHPEAIFSQAVESCRFDVIRKAIDSGQFNNHPEKYRYIPFNSEDPESHKFRKGNPGGYKDYMSEQDIAYCNDALKGLVNHWQYL